MVGESLPRADRTSASAIFRMLARGTWAFGSVNDLAGITVPTLIIPAADERHPADVAVRSADMMPQATLADVTISNQLENADEYAHTIAPSILGSIDRTVG